jgi:hypothetical protein
LRYALPATVQIDEGDVCAVVYPVDTETLRLSEKGGKYATGDRIETHENPL